MNLRHIPFALILFAVALALRLYPLATTSFDGLYGQDAYAYYAFSADLFPTLISGGALPPFNYPLGYPALLAAAFAVFGTSASVALAVNVLLGAACAPLAYMLAPQVGCRPLAACAAGLILAVSGQSIQSSVVIMSDIPALFWLMISFALMNFTTEAQRTQRGEEKKTYSEVKRRGGKERINSLPLFPSLPPKYAFNFSVSSLPLWFNPIFALSVLCLTLAILTRWQFVAALPAWIAALILSRRRPRLRDMAAAALLSLPLVAAQAAYSATNPFPTVNHPFVANWSLAHIAQRAFDTDDGHFEYTQPNGIFYAQVAYASPYLSPLLGLMAIIGMGRIFEPLRHRGHREGNFETRRNEGNEEREGFEPQRRKGRKGIYLLVWLVVPYLFLAGIPHQNIRYALIMLPPVAILCALGIDTLFAFFASLRFIPFLRTPHRAPLTNTQSLASPPLPPSLFTSKYAFISVPLWFISLFLLTSLLSDGHGYAHAFIERQQRDKAVVLWARDMLPAATPIYTQGLTAALAHYSALQPIELYGLTPQSLATLPPYGYLLINNWQIVHQWAGQSPQRAVEWLGGNRGLREVGQMNDYTLYQVGVP